MNYRIGVRVVALDVATQELLLEAVWRQGQDPARHLVHLTAAEARDFGALLQEHPFGALEDHRASIERLATKGSSHSCGVRLSKSGSRLLRTVAIEPSTYAAFKRVLDTNVLSDGYVQQ